MPPSPQLDLPFPDPAIASAYAAFPARMRPKLLRARVLILTTAQATDGVGPIEEALKWGQPAFLTSATKSGSPVRLGVPRSPAESWAVFVHCQTGLIQEFRTHYPSIFRFEGTRAILFSADEEIPEEALSHCIALALTYHKRKR